MPPPWRRWGAGALLALLAGLHLLAALDWHVRAGYLDAGLLAVCLAAAAAAAAVVARGTRPDWLLAGGVAAAGATAYLVSRAVGWPGAGREVGDWSSAPGSAALLVEVGMLVLAGIALRRPRPALSGPGPRGRSPEGPAR
jgi:hypothetical protein